MACSASHDPALSPDTRTLERLISRWGSREARYVGREDVNQVAKSAMSSRMSSPLFSGTRR